MPAGGLQPGAQVSDDGSDSECAFLCFLCLCALLKVLVRDPEDNTAKMRRAVRANNFTQQTNALDVDKHMYVLYSLLRNRHSFIFSRRLAYIEENMKLRRGRAQQSTDPDSDADPEGSKQEDLFNNLDPRYKVERKPGEEGSVTNSLSMLTAIPEVDLGMEYASLNSLLPSSLILTRG
jgi:hypothetical protein